MKYKDGIFIKTKGLHVKSPNLRNLTVSITQKSIVGMETVDDVTFQVRYCYIGGL